MKRSWFLLLVFLSANVVAQNRDNIWQLGSVNVQTGNSFYLDFTSGIADTGVLERSLQFFTNNASICDTNGELLFYTNGVWLANRNHDTLLNSVDFNPGFATDFYGQDNDGLGIDQASIILPKPAHDLKYEIFYLTAELVTAHGWTNQAQPLHMSLSEIDMSLDSGEGGIVANEKNVHILDDTLTQGRITACKHGNGRDWWIISHKFYSDMYYIFLLTPDSVYLHSQQIGNLFSSDDINGMAVFSPDGSEYAHLNINDTIDLLSFDRCEGEFSNFIQLSVPDTSTLSATLGCSFSPNSRFLYVSTYWSLYQFDTWANDIEQSIIKVGTWHDLDGWPDYFFLHQLAPDGKIYISPWGSTNRLHVVNSPDSLGLACDFIQAGLMLPYVAPNSSLPNFPNYDLGALAGSACDTLFLNNTVMDKPSIFRLYPNPANDWLNIVYHTNEDALFELYDAYGKRVAAVSLFSYFKNRLMDVSELPADIYLAVVTSEGKRIWSEKIVITH